MDICAIQAQKYEPTVCSELASLAWTEWKLVEVLATRIDILVLLHNSIAENMLDEINE